MAVTFTIFKLHKKLVIGLDVEKKKGNSLLVFGSVVKKKKKISFVLRILFFLL